jgi:hypothetical protein
MKKNNLALSFSLVAALAIFQISQVSAQTSAAEAIAQGRAALTKQTPEGIAEAISAFNVAVDSEPSNAEANFFKVVGLMLQTAGSEEFRKQFLDIGVNIASNPYDTSLIDYTPGYQGILKPEENATTDAHLDYLNSQTAFLEEVLSHLEKITTPTFSVTLTATETSLLQARVDYADVCLLRAGVHLAKAAIALGNSYNISAQYREIYDLFEANKLNPENVMKEFPLLLSFSPTPQRRSSAKNSFKAAYNEWAKAYPLLKARSEDVSESLFGFESVAYVQELNDVFFSVINSALDSATVLPLIDPFGYFPQEPKLNLSSLFSTSQAPRSYFPTVFDRGYFRPNAWADPTFGGILPQGTQSYATDLGVASWLVQHSVYEPYEPTPPSPAQTPSGGGGAAPAVEKSKKGSKKSGGSSKKSSAKKSGGSSKKSSAKKSGGASKKSGGSSKKSSAKKSGGSSKKSSAKKSGGASKKSSAKKSIGSSKKSSAKKLSGNSKGSKRKSKKSGGKKK